MLHPFFTNIPNRMNSFQKFIEMNIYNKITNLDYKNIQNKNHILYLQHYQIQYLIDQRQDNLVKMQQKGYQKLKPINSIIKENKLSTLDQKCRLSGQMYQSCHLKTMEKVIMCTYRFQDISKNSDYKQKALRKRASRLQQKIMKQHEQLKKISIQIKQSLENQEKKVIIYEYFSGITLADRIQRRVQIQQDEALAIIKHIIKIYYTLRQYKIPVVCIQPEDLIEYCGRYKIIDFGFLKIQAIWNFKNKAQEQKKAQMYRFVAPQLINQPQLYTPKAFVWNIGILLYYILFGKLPTANEINEITTLCQNHSRKISSKLKLFLSRCLMKDPEYRLDWKQMLTHKIFTLINQQKIGVQLILYEDNHKYLQVQQTFNLKNELKMLQQAFNEVYQIEHGLITKEGVKIQKQSIKQDDKIKQYKQMKTNKILLLQCVWLYNKVYSKIQTITFEQIADQRWKLQLQYLILIRIRLDLYNVQKKSKLNFKDTNFMNFFLNLSIQKTCKQFIDIKLISQKINKVSQDLKTIQSFYKEIVKDKFKFLFQSSYQKKKIKFLEGVENLDYKRSQQIQFIMYFFNKRSLLKIDEINEIVENFKIYTSLKDKNVQEIEFIIAGTTFSGLYL